MKCFRCQHKMYAGIKCEWKQCLHCGAMSDIDFKYFRAYNKYHIWIYEDMKFTIISDGILSPKMKIPFVVDGNIKEETIEKYLMLL